MKGRRVGEEEWGRSEGESGTKVGRKRQRENANGRRSGEMKGTRAAKRKRGTKGREMRERREGTTPAAPSLSNPHRSPNTQHHPTPTTQHTATHHQSPTTLDHQRQLPTSSQSDGLYLVRMRYTRAMIAVLGGRERDHTHARTLTHSHLLRPIYAPPHVEPYTTQRQTTGYATRDAPNGEKWTRWNEGERKRTNERRVEHPPVQSNHAETEASAAPKCTQNRQRRSGTETAAKSPRRQGHTQIEWIRLRGCGEYPNRPNVGSALAIHLQATYAHELGRQRHRCPSPPKSRPREEAERGNEACHHHPCDSVRTQQANSTAGERVGMGRRDNGA